MSNNEQNDKIAELVGQAAALEHVIVTLIEFLGPDVGRRMIKSLKGNPQPRALHSLYATECLSETLSRIRHDLEGIGFVDDDC